MTESDKPTPQELINEVRHTLFISRKMGRKTIRIEDIEAIVGKAESISKILGITYPPLGARARCATYNGGVEYG